MGALTSKPFSFAARSWELLDRLAFDCTDTFFSTLKLSFRGKTVIRVLPDFSTNLLSEWISDRVRFSYDSLQNQPEFDSIYQFRISKLSQSFLHFFFKRFYTGSYFFDFVSAQQIRAITDFSGFSGRFYSDLSHLNFDSRTSYSFAYSQILQKSSFKNYFLLGINLRYQLPVFTVALRKLSTLNETFFFNFGYFTNNLVGDINFGSSIKIFQNVIRGKSKISRIYYSASSVVFTNPFIYPLIPSNTTPYVYSFFDNPKNLISAEVFSKFYSVFPPAVSLYIPHFFASSQVFPRNNKLQRFDSPLLGQENSYNFYFFSKKLATFTSSSNYCISFAFNSSVYMYDNYYSHFNFSDSSSSSLNILLSVKRQFNSRSNFTYYN